MLVFSERWLDPNSINVVKKEGKKKELNIMWEKFVVHRNIIRHFDVGLKRKSTFLQFLRINKNNKVST